MTAPERPSHMKRQEWCRSVSEGQKDKEVKGNQNTLMEMKDLALARAADWSVPPVGTEWLYIAMTMPWNELMNGEITSAERLLLVAS